ncbi:MAG: hypothetical protein NUW37_06370 [Planctomycetes bacterium]|nr:hypothetical protein [Planctomycetota bacterium]
MNRFVCKKIVAAIAALNLTIVALAAAQTTPTPATAFNSQGAAFTNGTATATWGWTDNSANETHFVIRENPSGIAVGAVATGSTTFTENVLAPGTIVRDVIAVNTTLNGGTGADGNFDSGTYTSGIPGLSKSGNVFTINTNGASSGVYNFERFILRSGDTLTATGANILIIRCTGEVQIDGTIDVSGGAGGSGASGVASGAAGTSGPGAGAGGRGGNGTLGSPAAAAPGAGSGGGSAGTPSTTAPGGGGGGHSAIGTTGAGTGGGAGGIAYGGTGGLTAGSGGGGGAVDNSSGQRSGGSGGGGGGAIHIVSLGAIKIGTSGRILADGGNGGSSSDTAGDGISGGGGGAGSGGGILLQAGTVTISNASTPLSALGGTGGISANGNNGGGGANGYIQIEDSDGIVSGSSAAVPVPTLVTATYLASAASSTATVSTAGQAPTNFGFIAPASETTVTWTWNTYTIPAGVQSPDHFELQDQFGNVINDPATGTPFIIAQGATATVTSFTETGLKGGLTYQRRLVPVYSATANTNVGSPSNIVSAMTNLPAPTNFQWSISGNTITYTWDDNSSSEAGFLILDASQSTVTPVKATGPNVGASASANEQITFGTTISRKVVAFQYNVDRGTGADGPLTVQTYTTGIAGITVAGTTMTIDPDESTHAGVYNFTLLNFAAGTITTIAVPDNSVNPITIKVYGDMHVGGTIDLSGQSGAQGLAASTGGAGGAGRASGGAGGSGGNGTSSATPGTSGSGTGGGAGGAGGGDSTVAGGNGGSHAQPGIVGGTNTSAASAAYGSQSILTLVGGSGGGGGGSTVGGTNGNTGGSGGGGGGGAIYISVGGALNILSAGRILANGGTGGAGQTSGGVDGAGGGGGSGGVIKISALTINNASTAVDTLSVAGGAGGAQASTVVTAQGGGGSQGYVRVEQGSVGGGFSQSFVTPSNALSIGNVTRTYSSASTSVTIDLVVPGDPSITSSTHQQGVASRALTISFDLGKAAASPTPDHFYYVIDQNDPVNGTPPTKAQLIASGIKHTSGQVTDTSSIAGSGSWWIHAISANASKVPSANMVHYAIVIDAAPFVTKRETQDSNGNGMLDRIKLTLSEAVNDDFTDIAVNVTGYVVNGVSTGQTQTDNIIFVDVQEIGAADTGVTPQVQITANTLLAESSVTAGFSPGALALDPGPQPTTDTAAPVITFTSPAAGSTDTSISLTYTITEAMSILSARWADNGTGTATDPSGAAHVVNLATTDKTKGTHTAVAVAPPPALVKNVSYDVELSGQDSSGNIAVTRKNAVVAYNLTTGFFGVKPASNSYISAPIVSYNLYDAATSIGVTITQSGGTADPNSPHSVTLSAPDLTVGAHTVDLTSLLTNPLIDGAVYSFAFAATVGTAVNVTSTSITYDSLVPTITSRTSIDSDSNGLIDKVQIGTTELLNDDFGGIAITVLGYTISSIDTGSTANDQYFDINVTELAQDQTQTPSMQIISNSTLGDVAGNRIAVDGTPQVVTDGVLPMITNVSPASNGYFNGPVVSYTLSETFATLSIVVTHVSGSTDPNSPYTNTAFSSNDLAKGNHSSVALGAVSSGNLIETAVYKIDFTGTDLAGNATAQTTTVTNLTLDSTPPTITRRELHDSDGNGIVDSIKVICSENLGDGFSGITAQVTGYTLQSNPYDTGASAEDKEWFIRFVEPTANPTAAVPVEVSVNSSLGDKAGNLIAVDPPGGVTATDSERPVFSGITPFSNMFVQNGQVAYTISETLASGSATWTRTGGADDTSTHTITFTGADLTKGAHTGVGSVTLVEGAVYKVVFAGTDLFGNQAFPIDAVGVTVDLTAPTISNVYPANGAVVPGTAFAYTLSEDLASLTIVYTWVAGNHDPAGTHTVSGAGEETRAGVHTFSYAFPMTNEPRLVVGAKYNITVDGSDFAGFAASQVTVQNVTIAAPTVQRIVGGSSSGGGGCGVTTATYDLDVLGAFVPLFVIVGFIVMRRRRA